MSYETIEVSGHSPIKAWVKDVPFEDAARRQLINVASLPFVGPHVAAMSDVHFGKGATIGSVIPTSGAIIPAAVGVDIGCVDCETEFLSQDGWLRIDQWPTSGDHRKVMQYDLATGEASFVTPSRFVKEPCDEFYRVKTKYGVDQKLSADHRVLYAAYTRSYQFDQLHTISAADLVEWHEETVLGFRGRFLTTFTPMIETSLFYTDEALRVLVMIAADGHVANETTGNTVLQFRKQRKVARATELLEEAAIKYTLRRDDNQDVTRISFTPPFVPTKTLSMFWPASLRQLHVIASEVFYWDGNFDDRVFYTRDKASADFMSYCFAAVGKRSVLRADERDGAIDYRVYAHDNTKVGIAGTPKSPIEREPSVDGYKYCFTVPSGFWVMRRNGVIAITGNCGMAAVRTDLTSHQLPDSLAKLRTEIEREVPHGRTHNGGAGDRGAWHDLPATVEQGWLGLAIGFDEILAKHPKLGRGNDANHLGTLGTGNHFVEVCLDETDHVWFMLHSGSRGVGNRIGSYFIELAKKDVGTALGALPDKDLAYLTEGTVHFDDYVEAVSWAQDYAQWNRRLMMRHVAVAMRSVLGNFAFTGEAINCHHNYVQKELHFGREVFITRKGAVSAQEGQLGVIPGSMGTRSYIVRGKGNPESFHSCSHGAGRRMSRTEAKERFTLADHEHATAGVECRKDVDVIDETPMAYKDIDAVMAAQTDLVEVVHTLKQIVCIKG